MTKSESAHITAQTVLLESAEQVLQLRSAAGVRLAIPNTNNLIMVGTADWIAANVLGVEAMAERYRVVTDDEIDAIEKKHSTHLSGWEWSGNIIDLDHGCGRDFARTIEREVITRLAATTQASTAQAEVARLRKALLDVRHAVQFSSESIGGAITGDVRMMHHDGTVFDFIDATLGATSSTDAQAAAEVRDAAGDVLAERRRQVEVEGWSPEHDDKHDIGEMAAAACCYAFAGSDMVPDEVHSERTPMDWPWAPEWWKPSGKRRNLVKAGAMILAEIERLDRAALRSAGDTGGAA